MKLAVSYNETTGEIVTLFDPERLRNDKGTLRYVPAPGEKHLVIEVPAEHANTPFAELPHVLRVEANGGQPHFAAKA